MKNSGDREAGKCSKVVPDRGDRCLFIFLWSRRLFCNVFPYPVCKAQLIGDWYENRQGAQNTIILLIIRQYYWRTDVSCANILADRTRKKNYWLTVSGKDCLLAEGDIGAPIYWRNDPPCSLKKKQPARQLCWWCGGIYPTRFKEAHRTVRCASPSFIPIAY